VSTWDLDYFIVSNRETTTMRGNTGLTQRTVRHCLSLRLFVVFELVVVLLFRRDGTSRSNRRGLSLLILLEK
jgi:hypothetical protein